VFQYIVVVSPSKVKTIKHLNPERLRPIFWLIPQYNRKFSYTAAATSTRTRTDAINKHDTRKGKIIWKQQTGTAFLCWQSDTKQT
jgi:hypothetical protein